MWSAVAAAAKWDFGDGSAPASGESVDHTYAQPGSYTVTVRSATRWPNETTKTFTVAVTAAPPAGTPRPAGGGDETKPTVTLRPPRCRRSETKRACARRRHTLRAWRVLHGAAHDASPSSGICSRRDRDHMRNSRGSGPDPLPRGGNAARQPVVLAQRRACCDAGRTSSARAPVDRAGNVSATGARKLPAALSGRPTTARSAAAGGGQRSLKNRRVGVVARRRQGLARKGSGEISPLTGVTVSVSR